MLVKLLNECYEEPARMKDPIPTHWASSLSTCIGALKAHFGHFLINRVGNKDKIR